MFGFNIPWMAYAIAGMLAILAGTNAYTYFKATAAAEARCEAAALRMELATARADLQAAINATDRAQQAERSLTADRDAMSQRIESYEATLQGRDACSLTPGDLDRLRQLGGPH